MKNVRGMMKVSAAFALAAWLVAGVRADFISIMGPKGNAGLGSFEGSLDYHASDSQHAILTLVLKNTSPLANGGFLTAFAFNNPNLSIKKATLAGGTAFQLLGGSTFNNSVNGAPFGVFDIGISTGKDFEGGGSPLAGLGVGQVGTFTITVSGVGLDSLSANSFAMEISAPPKNGEGNVPFEARFRGFCDGGSDHVPGYACHQTPEPGALILGGMGFMAVLGFGYYRGRREE